MQDIAVSHPALAARLAGGAPLAASLLRELWGPAAARGLGALAARSLQQEFDEAVSVLAAVADALDAARQQLAGLQAAIVDTSLPPEQALAALRAAVPGQGRGAAEQEDEQTAAVRRRLQGWQERVRQHQDPGRVLARMQPASSG